MANVICYDGKYLDGRALYTIDDCLSFVSNKSDIEAAVARLNDSLSKGTITMQQAYMELLMRFGCFSEDISVRWASHHKTGNKIEIEDAWYMIDDD